MYRFYRSRTATALTLGLVTTLQMLLTSCQQPKALSEDDAPSTQQTLPSPIPSGWRIQIPVPPSQLQPSGNTENKELRYGFIDKTGKFVIPPEFKTASYFDCGLAPVMTDKGQAYVDKSGRFVTQIGEYITFGGGTCGDSFPKGLYQVRKDVQIPVSKGNKTDSETRKYFGYVNSEGKLVIPLTSYYSANGFSKDGMARVHIATEATPDEIEEASQRGKGDGDTPGIKLGYIDTTGILVIPSKFDRAEDFRWGVAKVGIKHFEPDPTNTKQKRAVIYYGFIDKKGRYLIEPRPSLQLDCDAGRLLVKRSQELMGKDALTMDTPVVKELCGKGESEYRRDGFVSESEPIPPSTSLTDNYLTNYAGKKLFRSDLDGGFPYYQTAPEYTLPVSEGLALIQRNDDYYCYINNQGTIVIPCKFKEATLFSEGLAAVAIEIDPKKK